MLEPRMFDVERVVALWLAGAAELAELVAGRVYTVTPKDVGDAPFVLVRRVGGEPPLSRPLVLDAVELQVDGYGGSKRVAHDVTARAQALLSELAGTVSDGVVVGRVTGTRLGVMRHLPDEAWSPARQRYVLDVTVFARRAAQVPSGSSTTAAAVTAAGTAPAVNAGRE